MRSLALLTLVATIPGAFAAEITLLETANLASGGLVRLGDVAEIRGADARRLADLPLMPKPAPGAGQLVSAQAVREMLAAQGESPTDHRFGGAYFVKVATPDGSASTARVAVPPSDGWRAPVAQEAAPRQNAFRVRTGVGQAAPVQRRSAAPRALTSREQTTIKEAVAAAIQQAIDAEGLEERLAVRDVQLTETALRELNGASIQSLAVRLSSSEQVHIGTNTVRVASPTDSGAEPFRVVVDLVVQPMRVVAASPLQRDAMIVTSMVRLEPVPLEELDRPRSRGYTTLDQVVGREAIRPLRAGDILSDANTAPPLMVQRGEEVTVSSGGGGVSVRVRAVAKQDGRQGELVPVETLDLEEKFMARVVGPRRLAVLSAGPSVANVTRTGGLQ